jgi:RNA polymerase sigma factor (sigma-70 family)
MEVSALRYSGGIGLHARSPLLRLQSDERLVSLIRRGSTAAFEVLVARYHSRLLAFCRHLLGSREDAEDVLQEVFSAAFNALLDDDRPINVRPWLYRIARNRSLNHLRRIQAVGVDSMDIHLHDHGATTADKVHEREEFRLLVDDIQGLPETQRTALVLREMDALSYEQIAEAMETTVPSVKSLLVRARVSLAEAAQARVLSCEQVREELAEVAEGLRRRPGPLVRRHLRCCERCSTFKSQLNETSKALTAVLPVGGGFFLLRKLALLHLGHSAGAGSSASGAGAASQAAAVGSTAAAGATAVMGTTGGGLLSASVGAIATKAVAGLAAAALVTAGAVEVEQPARPHVRPSPRPAPVHIASVRTTPTAVHTTGGVAPSVRVEVHRVAIAKHPHKAVATKSTAATAKKTPLKTAAAKGKLHTQTKPTATALPGKTQTQTEPTVLASATTPAATSAPATTTGTTCPASTPAPTTTTSSTPSTDTTPSSSGDPGTGTSGDPGTGTSTDPGTDSTPTTTTTSPTTTTTTPTQATSTTPPPSTESDTSCSSDSSGSSSSTTPAPSGGTAP